MPSVEDGFRLLIYTDAPFRGGAEMTLAHVLAGLPPQIEVSVLGVDSDVVTWLADHRPGASATTTPPIRDRTDLGAMRAHRRAFADARADIVHFNLGMMSSCQWAIAAALTLRGSRCVVVENSPVATWSALSSRLKRQTSRRLAGHVAVGKRTARTVEEQAALPPGSVRTIYHGVPDVDRTPADRISPEPLIGTIARHDPVKGLDVLIDAMPLIPDVRLVLIGSGPETQSLRDRCDRLGVADRVEFRDVPWNESAADHLASFDLFVLPSRDEGFPVTIMEAMLAGIPVVATDVGSVRESVDDGTTGLVVPPEDPAALAEAIRRLIDDPAMRTSLGAEARRRGVERFTVEATVGAYLDLYREVLAS